MIEVKYQFTVQVTCGDEYTRVNVFDELQAVLDDYLIFEAEVMVQ